MGNLRPILFSPDMVQAILSGNKTQTRRIIKPQLIANKQYSGGFYIPKKIKETVNVSLNAINEGAFLDELCGQGIVGDILWIRESWKISGWDFDDNSMIIQYADGTKQCCDIHDTEEGEGEWLIKKIEKFEKKGYIKISPENKEMFVFTDKKQPFEPSIHMPKEAARIFLEIVSVKAQRLYDITRQDAFSEGITNGTELEDTKHEVEYYQYKFGGPRFPSAVQAFYALWEKINGAESLDKNPWVWVIEFKRVDKPNNF